MTAHITPMLSQEWLALQSQYEQYERGALLIKLVCLVLFATGLMLTFNLILAALFVLIFWLQEGIFRTYQTRLGSRILQVEAGLKPGLHQDGGACQPFQLHSEWLRTRPSAMGLLCEYAKNAARPTVAFPYLILLLLDVMVFALWKLQ